MEHVARADLVLELWRVGGVRRVLHRVEVVEVAEELVEAVDGRQVLVAVAEVVLAELPGGVALRLERRGDRRSLGRHADLRAGLTDGGEPGADRKLAGDEVRAPRRAARLGVVVGEAHALGGEPVEVRRSARHHARWYAPMLNQPMSSPMMKTNVRLLLRISILLCHARAPSSV